MSNPSLATSSNLVQDVQPFVDRSNSTLCSHTSHCDRFGVCTLGSHVDSKDSSTKNFHRVFQEQIKCDEVQKTPKASRLFLPSLLPPCLMLWLKEDCTGRKELPGRFVWPRQEDFGLAFHQRPSIPEMSRQREVVKRMWCKLPLGLKERGGV
jgi:hypothetical protein